jgi:hypothetical protein
MRVAHVERANPHVRSVGQSVSTLPDRTPLDSAPQRPARCQVTNSKTMDTPIDSQVMTLVKERCNRSRQPVSTPAMNTTTKYNTLANIRTCTHKATQISKKEHVNGLRLKGQQVKTAASTLSQPLLYNFIHIATAPCIQIAIPLQVRTPRLSFTFCWNVSVASGVLVT